MRFSFLPLYLLSICSLIISGCADRKLTSVKSGRQHIFDWQGHRGCRGLMPENTIQAFVEALKYPVTTLELDVVVSSDGELVVSHEPWMNPAICLDPQGNRIPDAAKFQHNLYQLTTAEIQKYDCGKLGNPRFPAQQKLKTFKPTLAQVVAAVRAECAAADKEIPLFNIEIKSDPQGYDVFMPQPAQFVRIVRSGIDALDIGSHTVLQSFDLNVLREIRSQNTDGIPVSYLTSSMRNLEAAVEKLGYTPDIYSPNYHLVTRKMIRYARQHNIRVIPWTVNKTCAMRRLINRGVDGIITDYPDRIGELTPRPPLLQREGE